MGLLNLFSKKIFYFHIFSVPFIAVHLGGYFCLRFGGAAQMVRNLTIAGFAGIHSLDDGCLKFAPFYVLEYWLQLSRRPVLLTIFVDVLDTFKQRFVYGCDIIHSILPFLAACGRPFCVLRTVRS